MNKASRTLNRRFPDGERGAVAREIVEASELYSADAIEWAQRYYGEPKVRCTTEGCGYVNDMTDRGAYELTLCAKCGENLPGITDAVRNAAFVATYGQPDEVAFALEVEAAGGCA